MDESHSTRLQAFAYGCGSEMPKELLRQPTMNHGDAPLGKLGSEAAWGIRDYRNEPLTFELTKIGVIVNARDGGRPFVGKPATSRGPKKIELSASGGLEIRDNNLKK